MTPDDAALDESELQPPLEVLDLDLSWERTDVAAIHVRGELDRDSVPELASRVKEVLAAGSPCRTLILDLGGLRFMDVGGMRLLLDAHEQATGSGVAFLIVGCPPRILRVLRITQTAHLLPLAPPQRTFRT
jgi:anti-sigma B factor antagonist